MKFLPALILLSIAAAVADEPPIAEPQEIPRTGLFAGPLPPWILTLIKTPEGQVISFGYQSKEACEREIPKMEREQHAVDGRCDEMPGTPSK